MLKINLLCIGSGLPVNEAKCSGDSAFDFAMSVPAPFPVFVVNAVFIPDFGEMLRIVRNNAPARIDMLRIFSKTPVKKAELRRLLANAMPQKIDGSFVFGIADAEVFKRGGIGAFYLTSV